MTTTPVRPKVCDECGREAAFFYLVADFGTGQSGWRCPDCHLQKPWREVERLRGWLAHLDDPGRFGDLAASAAALALAGAKAPKDDA